MYVRDMIEGSDILKGTEDLTVIPVNLVGVFGKGLALQCKEQFPRVYEIYSAFCGSETFQKPGDLMNVKSGGKHFILFPTKIHWRNLSKIEWITTGLHSLHAFLSAYLRLNENRLLTIAIPPLGCGLGGLDRGLVLIEIKTILSSLPHNVKVHLYDFHP